MTASAKATTQPQAATEMSTSFGFSSDPSQRWSLLALYRGHGPYSRRCWEPTTCTMRAPQTAEGISAPWWRSRKGGSLVPVSCFYFKKDHMLETYPPYVTFNSVFSSLCPCDFHFHFDYRCPDHILTPYVIPVGLLLGSRRLLPVLRLVLSHKLHHTKSPLLTVCFIECCEVCRVSHNHELGISLSSGMLRLHWRHYLWVFDVCFLIHKTRENIILTDGFLLFRLPVRDVLRVDIIIFHQHQHHHHHLFLLLFSKITIVLEYVPNLIDHPYKDGCEHFEIDTNWTGAMDVLYSVISPITRAHNTPWPWSTFSPNSNPLSKAADRQKWSRSQPLNPDLRNERSRQLGMM